MMGLMNKYCLTKASIIIVLFVLLLSIACQETSYRDEILDAEGTMWRYFYDAKTRREIGVGDKDRILVKFNAEGMIFKGYDTKIAGIHGTGKYLCGFYNGRFFSITEPSELVGINPKIENEEQALLFVRFFTTPGYLYLFRKQVYRDHQSRLLAWISSTVPFVEVFKEGVSNESNTISTEEWNTLGLEDVVAKKENDVFVIERNGVINNKGAGPLDYGLLNQLIRSSEMVTSDGNYLFTVKKKIGILKNPIMLCDNE